MTLKRTLEINEELTASDLFAEGRQLLKLGLNKDAKACFNCLNEKKKRHSSRNF